MTEPKAVSRGKGGEGCNSRREYYKRRVLRLKGELPPVVGEMDTLESCAKALSGL